MLQPKVVGSDMAAAGTLKTYSNGRSNETVIVCK